MQRKQMSNLPKHSPRRNAGRESHQGLADYLTEATDQTCSPVMVLILIDIKIPHQPPNNPFVHLGWDKIIPGRFPQCRDEEEKSLKERL